MTKFWEGFFSVFTFGQSLRYTKQRTDAEKMADDWRKVGDDMRRAIEQTTPPTSRSA